MNLLNNAAYWWAGALGFSLGGWCGTMLTMRHPEIFGAASVGAYYRPLWVGPAP